MTTPQDPHKEINDFIRKGAKKGIFTSDEVPDDQINNALRGLPVTPPKPKKGRPPVLTDVETLEVVRRMSDGNLSWATAKAEVLAERKTAVNMNELLRAGRGVQKPEGEK